MINLTTGCRIKEAREFCGVKLSRKKAEGFPFPVYTPHVRPWRVLCASHSLKTDFSNQRKTQAFLSGCSLSLGAQDCSPSPTEEAAANS